VVLTEGRDPRVLDTRAAAEAAAGRFEAAIGTERRAIELAVQTINDTLVAGVRQRMALYRRRAAYVEPDHLGGPPR
jgi:predicted sulfurtransferase